MQGSYHPHKTLVEGILPSIISQNKHIFTPSYLINDLTVSSTAEIA